jgi:hypothetical protein
MATYQSSQYLRQHYDAKFNSIHDPGSIAPYSGIYRCVECNREVVSTAGHHLPPQNHHQHHSWQGKIRWQLIVNDN